MTKKNNWSNCTIVGGFLQENNNGEKNLIAHEDYSSDHSSLASSSEFRFENCYKKSRKIQQKITHYPQKEI